MDSNFLFSEPDTALKLAAVRRMNNRVAQALCDYLNENPCKITPELMREANPGGTMSEETVFRALLAEFCGLTDCKFLNDYLRHGVHHLDAQAYREDPFYRGVQIPEVKFGKWELKYASYVPYELFVCGDLQLRGDFREIPSVGFFSEPFRFPVVREGGREWMAIKPSEVETMRSPLEAVSGRVAVLGLGLGYFPFMAVRKPDVESVVLVERDAQAIALFRKYILPQFSAPQKVQVIHCNAFEFLEKTLPSGNFTSVFADLWHDASDGLELYLRTKELESRNSSVRFLYWAESSLISAKRWRGKNSQG